MDSKYAPFDQRWPLTPSEARKLDRRDTGIPRNAEGLTLAEWCAAAGWPAANIATAKAPWILGEDPTDHKAAAAEEAAAEARWAAREAARAEAAGSGQGIYLSGEQARRFRNARS